MCTKDFYSKDKASQNCGTTIWGHGSNSSLPLFRCYQSKITNMEDNWIKGTEKKFPETFSDNEDEGDNLSPEQVERAKRLNKRQNFGRKGDSKIHH